MKKNYILLAMFVLGLTVANAQFTDDIEGHAGPICDDNWNDWSDTCAIPLVTSTDFAHSGTQSAYAGPSDASDGVMTMGNQIFGAWGVQFWMYVASGDSGYFNMQGATPIAAGEWVVGNIFFNEGGATPGEGYIDYSTSDATAWTTFNFPHDEWFRVTMNYNIETGLSLATWDFAINTDVIVDGEAYADAAGVTATGLGGINFYSFGETNFYYIDDVDFRNEYFDPTVLSTDSFETKGFRSAMSNGTLTLKAQENISSVAIYNMLGQQVYNANVNALQSTVNMSNLSNGTYIVKVNINGTEGSVKVIK